MARLCHADTLVLVGRLNIEYIRARLITEYPFLEP